jgi:hypothetical protein
MIDRRSPALGHRILEAAWVGASSHMVGMGTRQGGSFDLGRITRFVDGIRSSADFGIILIVRCRMPIDSKSMR